MAVWLRLRRYLDGKWSLGYEIPTDFCEFAGTISYSRLNRLYWLEIKNDEEWHLLGEKNLCLILSNQKKQLRAVKAARRVVKRHVHNLIGVNNPELVGATWREWFRHERNQLASETYLSHEYCHRFRTVSLEDFQKIANDYTTAITEIKHALVQFEKICASVEPAHNENQVPPILPWLRPDGYFKEGDEVVDWESHLNYSRYVGGIFYWKPYLREITHISDGEVHFSVDLGPNKRYITSPKTMFIQEAKYYSENNFYRQFLLERLKSTDRTFPEILSALGDKKRLKSVL